MRLKLSEIAKILGPALNEKRGEVTGYSIDSRTLRHGDLFFAVRGPRFDGHDFIDAAWDSGAAAVVAERPWAAAHEPRGALFAVDDVARGLRELAADARRRWGRPIVGVTGSNGKTTTKEAIAALLARRFRVAKSEGNLNNDLGLPLSLLRADDASEAGVFEMGMNHRGEIARLAQIAAPTVGVVTNVSEAHVEYFSSADEIALAKRELIEALPADGTAVLNADDKRVRAFRDVHDGPVVTFGAGAGADFQATRIETLGAEGVRFVLRRKGSDESVRFQSGLVGRHNAVNLAAALATASVFGVDSPDLVDAVGVLRPASRRGETSRLGGALIVDDCYNANPRAMEAMLVLLADTPASRRIAVLGEMRELGEHSEELHRRVGRAVAEHGIDLLLGVTGAARYIVDEAVRRGMPQSRTTFFEHPEDAGQYVADCLRPDDAVLFKASRGVALERALALVQKQFGDAESLRAAPVVAMKGRP
ncbi:MAG: UDP-N-acetylmuramoyl-tripeptide--D-alanyl-D-alanine ligase [Acidobacteria bacterium]|nr:UDP-N-acetylmuramoyl-tripeptide--D-alanyl-D-alanine ligase [Acidobacteriota bacterium]